LKRVKPGDWFSNDRIHVRHNKPPKKSGHNDIEGCIRPKDAPFF